jgi:tetratricopeptide (TPR) repeat protein
MRNLFLILVLTALLFPACAPALAQNSGSSSSSTPPADSTSTKQPDLSPPRSDRVNANSLPEGESSSRDTDFDISPPKNDVKAQPGSPSLTDEGSSATRPWDPHKAAKDIEVGDFYFKRKNYRAAEDRYREALYYKDNDATATLHLAECLDKLDEPGEAREQYEAYLKILPEGPQSEKVRKAIDRLKSSTANGKPAK